MLIRKDDTTVVLKECRKETYYYKSNQGWFFNTRENFEFGPYDTKMESMRARLILVKCIEHTTTDKAVAPLETISALLNNQSYFQESA